jgi:hypothetical protein
VEKEVRGAAGETKAETTLCDAAVASANGLPLLEVETAVKTYTAEEKLACSIEAMRNGGT